MDITLSEAPIYVVIQTCLTPALLEQAFFYECTSSFRLPLCWLRLLAPVTDLSKLPGILRLAASMHPE
ncbi:hypothetical protein AL479_23055 [Citrobacter amalonaticus]|nr:hypothetical protein AL479_23055 [Citrobacter amalonaticus]